MSIITLSSDGQSPSNFHSFFPQGLVFGKYAEISIMGYSGTTKVQDTNDPDAPDISEWVVNDNNNTFGVYQGQAGSNLDNIFYPPAIITIKPGTYSATGLQTEIQNRYSDHQRMDIFDTMEMAVPNAAQAINIKIGKHDVGAPTNFSNPINYDTGDNQGITQNPGGTNFEPFDLINGVHRYAFLDMKKNFMGQSQVPLGPGNPEGFKCLFQTQDQNWNNYAFSFGLVPREWISKADNPTTGRKKADLTYNLNNIINPQDFAINLDGSNKEKGHFVAGFAVDGDTGHIIVIADDVNGSVMNKIHYDTGIDLGAAGPKQFFINQKLDGNNRPVIEFSYDIGAGPTLAPGLPSGNGTIPLFNPQTNPAHQIYRFTERLHAGVVFDWRFTQPNTNLAGFEFQTLEYDNNAGNLGDYTNRTTLFWEPFNTDYNGGDYITINSNYARSECDKLTEKCNMKALLGYQKFFSFRNSNMYSTGITGASVDLPGTQDQLTQPLLITSPDLNAKGYVGAGAGGGAEAQILGIMRTQTNIGLNQQNFGESTNENWIKLNNAYPFTINRLQILIKDFTNKETNILQPTTRLWMKIRCDGRERRKKEITTGSFSASY